MIIKSARLNNIRSYTDAKIDFPEGCVMLSGDIGSGKSTILLAIEFALFGLTSELDGTALLRNGKNTGEVELRLSIENKEVLIKRSLKRIKDSVRQEAGYIVAEGQKQEGTPIELKAKVLELLGYPKELLTKSKSLIYRYTVYTPQEEMKLILQENNPTRLDTLRKVFQIDKYKRVKENTQVLTKGLKEKTREIAARTEDLPAKEARKKELEKELEIADVKASELQPRIELQESLTAGKRAAIAGLEEKSKEISEIKKNLEVTFSKIKEKTRLIKESEIEIARISAETEELKRKREASEQLGEQFMSLLAAARNERENALEQTGTKEKTKSELSETEAEATRLSAEIKKQQYIAESSKKSIENIHSLQMCPLCRQPVTAEHKEHITKTEEEKIANANSTIAESSENKKRTDEKAAKLREQLESIYEKEKYVSSISWEISACEETSARLAQLGLAQHAVQAAPAANIPEMRRMNRLIQESSQYNERISDKQKTILATKEKMTILNAEIEELNLTAEREGKKASELSGIEIQAANAKKELEELIRQEKILAMQKAAINAEQQGIKRNIELLRQEIESKKEARQEMEHLSAIRHWTDEHFISLIETIEKQAMLRVYNEFNRFFQDWFNVLMED